MDSSYPPPRLLVGVAAFIAVTSFPFRLTAAYAESCTDESGRLLDAPATIDVGHSQPCAINLEATISLYVLAENSYRLTWRNLEPANDYRQVGIRWKKTHLKNTTTDDCERLDWPLSLPRHYSGSTFIHYPLGHTCVEVSSPQAGPIEILQHVIENITAKDTSDLLKNQQISHHQDVCALSDRIGQVWMYRTHFDTLSFATSLSSALTTVYDAANPINDREFMKQWDNLAKSATDRSGMKSAVLKGLTASLTSGLMLNLVSTIFDNMSFRGEGKKVDEIKNRLADATKLVRDVEVNVHEPLQQLGTLSNLAKTTIDSVWADILAKSTCLTEARSFTEDEHGQPWDTRYKAAMNCSFPRSAPPQCTRDIVNLVLSSTALARNELREACVLLRKVTSYFENNSQIHEDARREFLRQVSGIQNTEVQKACNLILSAQADGPSLTDAM